MGNIADRSFVIVYKRSDREFASVITKVNAHLALKEWKKRQPKSSPVSRTPIMVIDIFYGRIYQVELEYTLKEGE